jgi:uncharacterized protein (UPF0333 family)
MGFKKRGQLQLSFGMIFSIILIIIFISVAFYAVVKLLEFQRSVQVASFLNNIEADIDSVWKSGGSQQRTYPLPSRIKKVCFVDYLGTKNEKIYEEGIWEELRNFFYETENMFFYPANSAGKIKARAVKNINLEKITNEENPFCIENTEGKVTMKISMDVGESLVTISK